MLAFSLVTLIGILAAAATFTTAYVIIRSRRPLRLALAAGILVFVFELAVFEFALGVELYRGILFGGTHFSNW